MRTIALISQKGGAGKTTLAIALAVTAERAGLASVLVDLDPQASAAQWSDLRQAKTPVANPLTDQALTAIAGYGVKACPVIVHQRIEHVHAFTAGSSASESAPSGKAAAEINELFNWTRSRDQW